MLKKQQPALAPALPASALVCLWFHPEGTTSPELPHCSPGVLALKSSQDEGSWEGIIKTQQGMALAGLSLGGQE